MVKFHFIAVSNVRGIKRKVLRVALISRSRTLDPTHHDAVNPTQRMDGLQPVSISGLSQVGVLDLCNISHAFN